MQRLFAHPKNRLAKSTPEEQAWFEQTHAVISAYFEGSESDQGLERALRGEKSWKLMTLTTPGTEQWSLLMSALDVLIGSEDGNPYGPTTRKTTHGSVSYGEWRETLFPPKVIKKERHSW